MHFFFKYILSMINYNYRFCVFLFVDGSKELFEACVVSVKSFLAGEPFSEFENSMYFHR